MSMERLNRSIQELKAEELARANEKFPLFASRHEGYAVTLEEVDELEAEMHMIKSGMRDLWMAIKLDAPEIGDLSLIGEHAVNAACEAVQIAAMCQKMFDSKSKPVMNDPESIWTHTNKKLPDKTMWCIVHVKDAKFGEREFEPRRFQANTTMCSDQWKLRFDYWAPLPEEYKYNPVEGRR